MRQLFLDQERGTGRSTAIALQVISDAMKQPGKPIRISDHHPTEVADRYLAGMVNTYLSRLNFENFEIAMERSNYFLIFKGLR